jgi:uncharacterized protein (TIGR02145 family)
MMKKILLVPMTMILLFNNVVLSQNVEIQGQTKITQMNNDNTVDAIVVRQPDGTLATRHASSLKTAFSDTTRNFNTDFELAKHMCECGTNLPPFMIQSLLDNGYSQEDLLRAGVPYSSIQDTYPIMDGDGNNYEYVTIGNKKWLSRNLETTTYNDGSPLPFYDDPADWFDEGEAGEPAYTFPVYNPAFKEDYGLLYNWYAIDSLSNGNKNVCPVGWHVPTYDDLVELKNLFDPVGTNLDNVAGMALKEPGLIYWLAPNPASNNISGFSGRGAGIINPFGDANIINNVLYILSRTSSSSTKAGFATMSSSSTRFAPFQYSKAYGGSVRCIKYD